MTEGPVFANWDDVADEGTMPTMRANGKMTSWERRETSTKRLMYRVGWMIDEPEQFRGMFVNDNMIVGSQDDGRKDKFDSTQRDSRRMKAMFTALQVNLDPDVEKCLRTSEGRKAALYITEPTKDEIELGYDRNRVRNYYTLGSVEVGLIEGKTGRPNIKAGTAPPPPPPAPPVSSAGLPRQPAPRDDEIPF
jgi:hypothetical protein